MNPLTPLDAAGLTLFALYATQQLASALTPRIRAPRAEGGVSLTFLIPALNEAQVIEPTLLNLRHTVPEARVVVIDDASDDDTAAIVERLAAHDPMVTLLRRTPPEARQNKGRAMNWAVARLLQGGLQGEDPSNHVFIGLDADGRIGPEFALQVRGAFADPNVMAAQGWMRYRQELPRARGLSGFLSRTLLFQQDLENFITGHTQRLRHRVGTASLTGNGQCMRASYVARQLSRGVAPWPDVLLEDFGSALEIRLESPEHRIAFLDTHVRQQGMIDLWPFLKQRARWIQGTMQCLAYLPRLWRSGAHPVTLADFSYLIMGPWLTAVMILTIVSQPLRRALGWQGLAVPAALNVLLSLLPLIFQFNWALRYRRERGLPWVAVPYAVATLPIFGFITLFAVPLAYYNHFSGRRGWYKSVRHDETPLGAGD